MSSALSGVVTRTPPAMPTITSRLLHVRCLRPSCGHVTSYYLKDGRGVSPPTEIVVCDFREARERRKPAQSDMFAEAAE